MVTDDQILEAVHDLLVDKTAATETFKYRIKPIVGENQSPFINIVTGPRGYEPDNSRAASKIRHTVTIIILVEGEEEIESDTFSSFVINQLDTIESQISDILDLYNDNWGLSEIMNTELTHVTTERENPDKNRTYAARYLTYELTSKKTKKNKPKLPVESPPEDIYMPDLENWSDTGISLLADQSRNPAITDEIGRSAILPGSGTHQTIHKIQFPLTSQDDITAIGTMPIQAARFSLIKIGTKYIAFCVYTAGAFSTKILRCDESDFSIWTEDGNTNFVPVDACTSFVANNRLFLASVLNLRSAPIASDAYLIPGNWTNHGNILKDDVFLGCHVDVTATHIYIYSQNKIQKGDLTDLTDGDNWNIASTHENTQSNGIGYTDANGEIWKVAGITIGPSRTNLIQKAIDKDSQFLAVPGKTYPWAADPLAFSIDPITKEMYGFGSSVDPAKRGIAKSGTKLIT